MPRNTDTRAATAAHQRYAVIRAVDDPKSLAKAAKIVREALRRQRLTLADITPDGDGKAAQT